MYTRSGADVEKVKPVGIDPTGFICDQRSLTSLIVFGSILVLFGFRQVSTLLVPEALWPGSPRVLPARQGVFEQS